MNPEIGVIQAIKQLAALSIENIDAPMSVIEELFPAISAKANEAAMCGSLIAKDALDLSLSFTSEYGLPSTLKMINNPDQIKRSLQFLMQKSQILLETHC